MQRLDKNKVANLSAIKYKEILDLGFNAVNSNGYWRAEFLARSNFERVIRWLMFNLFKYRTLSKCDQCVINKYIYVPEDKWDNVYPILLPQWDRSARAGKMARIYVGSTPDVFRSQIQSALSLLENKTDEHKILFLRSWNEWAEGNYVEPDLKYGHGYLDVLRECLIENK